jgi:hypothetical protein
MIFLPRAAEEDRLRGGCSAPTTHLPLPARFARYLPRGAGEENGERTAPCRLMPT